MISRYDKQFPTFFCAYYSSAGVSVCQNTNACKGSNDGNCYPHVIWSGTLNGTSKAYNRYLDDVWKENNNCLDNARSVRCVNGFIKI